MTMRAHRPPADRSGPSRPRHGRATPSGRSGWRRWLRASGTAPSVRAQARASAEPIPVEMATSVHTRPTWTGWPRGVGRRRMAGPDTYLVARLGAAACLAAGLTVAAVESVLAGERRPWRSPWSGRRATTPAGTAEGLLPAEQRGHRGGRRSAAGLAERIAVLDWDVHHGDGSEAIFGADPDVFYASTHQSPWYPGTGSVRDSSDTVLNVPLPAGTGDEAFLAAWQDTILPRVEAFRPDAIVVSAGFDAHRDDPLAWLEVTEAGFGAVARAVGECARRRVWPVSPLALEGGYDLDALRVSAAATIIGLVAGLSEHPRRGRRNVTAILGLVSSRRASMAPADRPTRRSRPRRSTRRVRETVGEASGAGRAADPLAGRDRHVRLQVRPPAEGRPRLRRPLPDEPVLGSGPPATFGLVAQGPSVRTRSAAGRPLPRPCRPAPRAHRPRVPRGRA